MKQLIWPMAFAVGLGLTRARSEETTRPSDRLAEALKSVGLDKADLGFRPKGYWSRFPDPQRMPYKMHFFDSLYAEPLRVYDFTLVLAQAVRDCLSVERLEKEPDSLFKLCFFLGIEHKVGGFRGYSANLDPVPAGDAPLLSAVRRAYEVTGSQMRTVVFGKKADWPDPEADLKKQMEGVDTEMEKLLASLLLNVVDAYAWRKIALRNAHPERLRAVFAMRDFHGHSTDGQSYPFQVDDAARDLDEQSLYYAAQKTVQAAQDAAGGLKALVLKNPDKYKKLSINVLTPLGRIVAAGTGNETHSSGDCAVLVDLGGDDTFIGATGATSSLDVPISIAIDLSGNDVYRCDDERQISQGAAIFGAGVLIDLAGNDTYQAKRGAQGYGLFGLGMLVDYQGDDQYILEYSGQGAGYFGIGLNLDGEGSDTYSLYGDGQGFGGPGGVGVLANQTGNDTYTAEPLAEKAGRPDYHSQMKIAVSQAQGCGAGSRADGSHGHAWAGGLGVLIDIQGNDRYESGNWSIGTGYWFGTGILYDGSGDDMYRSVYFTQASGAHFSIGVIIDEGGKDQHILYETGGAGIAFGWDFTVALLIDKGGDDLYAARMISIGCAQIRSNALLIDLGGNDTYGLPPGAEGMGSATFLDSYAKPSYSYGPYSLYGNSIGLLLDVGGKDQYLEEDFTTAAKKPSALAADNKIWFKPPKESPNFGYRSFGIGLDVETGTVPDFFLLENRR
ncbi:MAG: hypothetical protein HYU36_14400 [Planctomycetes bacterium]|nr:hypothetical protein [Planctomycetota bacterium]